MYPEPLKHVMFNPIKYLGEKYNLFQVPNGLACPLIGPGPSSAVAAEGIGAGCPLLPKRAARHRSLKTRKMMCDISRLLTREPAAQHSSA